MDYKILKQLRKANYKFIDAEHSNLKLRDVVAFEDAVYYAPSLEELIEACGEDFVNLNKVIDPKGWSCDIVNERDEIDEETFADTPIEAVAKLYLELNK